MSALPPSLRPWAAQLSVFPADLALHLGPHVARLSAALGALRPRGESEGGEPQGYDGLARRGPYERLLISEWLWALENPDELVRRAAFGELAFLKPAFRQPQGARRSVVLLDAGPDQLGAPRIAHLALLIVLARRAEAAGAAFTWGILQASPERGTFSEVTPTTLQGWLAARTSAPPGSEHLARWREALALERAPEDAWLVGSARLARLPEAAGLSRVEVEEVMEPGVRRLAVDVRPATRAARSLVLELPAPDDCVRLLRGPFGSHSPTPVRLGAGSHLRGFSFSGDGRRLVLHRVDGSVAAQAVPHSPNATAPKPRRLLPPADQTVVAAGWRYTGGLLVLTRGRSDSYVLHGQLQGPKGLKGASFPVREDTPQPQPPLPGERPGRLLSLLDAHGEERVLVLDARGHVFLLRRTEPGRTLTVDLLDASVTAAVEVGRKPVFVSRNVARSEEAKTAGAWLVVVEEGQTRHLPLEAEEGQASFGWSPDAAHPDAGLLAVCHRPGLWRVFLAGGHVDLSPPAGARVVGVCLRRTTDRPGLLLLAENKKTFLFATSTGVSRLTEASDEVVHAEASHGLPVLGWLTKAGELVLWSLSEEHVLLRAAPEARP
jgi:hypothetical protein